MKIVHQVSEGRIVYRSDKILSAKQLNKLFEKYGQVELYGNYRKLNYQGFKINILAKNITYLGNPHPLHKKRIQIPEAWKNLLPLTNTLLCGVYSGPTETFLVVFANYEFLLNNVNQSSAHVNTGEIIQANNNCDYKSPINTGTFKIVIQEERFQLYIDEFVQNIPNFSTAEDIYNWQKTYVTTKVNPADKISSNSPFEIDKKPTFNLTINSEKHFHFLDYLSSKSSARLYNRIDEVKNFISPIFGIDYEKISKIRNLGKNSLAEIVYITNQYQTHFKNSIIEDEILSYFTSYFFRNWKTSTIPEISEIIKNIKFNGGFCLLFKPNLNIDAEILTNIERLWIEFCQANIAIVANDLKTSNPIKHNTNSSETELENKNTPEILFFKFIEYLQQECSVRTKNRFREILNFINPHYGIDYSSISKIRNLGNKSIIELNNLTKTFQVLNNYSVVETSRIDQFREFINSTSEHFLINYQDIICNHIINNGGLYPIINKPIFTNNRTFEIIEQTWRIFISNTNTCNNNNIYTPEFTRLNLKTKKTQDLFLNTQLDLLNLLKSNDWDIQFKQFINKNKINTYKFIHKSIKGIINDLKQFWKIDLDQYFYSGNDVILKYIFIRFWKNTNESNYTLFKSIHDLNLSILTKERRRQIFAKDSRSKSIDLPFIVLEFDNYETLNLELSNPRNFAIKKIEKYIFLIDRHLDFEKFEIPRSIPLNALKLFAESKNLTISPGDKIFLKKENINKKDILKQLIGNYVMLNEENGIKSSHISEELELYGFHYPSVQIPMLINRLGLNLRQRWDWTWVIKDGNLDIDPIGLHSYSDFLKSAIIDDKLSLDESIAKLRIFYPRYRIKNAMSLISQLKDKRLYRIIMDEMIFGNWYKVEKVRKLIYNQLKYPKSWINKTVIWPSFIEAKYGMPKLIIYQNNYHWMFKVNNEMDVFDLRDYIFQISWNAFILIEFNNQIQNMDGEIVQLS